MTRYLTLFEFNNCKNSLKSFGSTLAIVKTAHQFERLQPFPGAFALPVSGVVVVGPKRHEGIGRPVRAWVAVLHPPNYRSPHRVCATVQTGGARPGLRLLADHVLHVTLVFKADIFQ